MRSARRPAIRSSSPGRRSATSSRSSSRRSTSRAAASRRAARSSPACRSSWSAAGRTSSWSATSSQADNIDLFVETLCGGDDHHYLFRGQCIADAALRRGRAEGERPARPGGRPSTRRRTARCIGTATRRRVEGRDHPRSARPAAGAAVGRRASTSSTPARSRRRRRSSRRCRTSSSRSTGSTPTTSTSRTSRAVGCRSVRRAPIRRCRRSGPAPTSGRAFCGPRSIPQAIDPPSGVILNWNNKPAADVGAADSNFAYGLDLPRRPARAEDRQAQEAHARLGYVGDERGGDAGSASGARLAGDPCGARLRALGRPASRSRSRRRRCSTSGSLPAAAASTLNGDGKVDAPGRGDHGRRLAEARRRRPLTGARHADRRDWLP